MYLRLYMKYTTIEVKSGIFDSIKKGLSSAKKAMITRSLKDNCGQVAEKLIKRRDDLLDKAKNEEEKSKIWDEFIKKAEELIEKAKDTEKQEFKSIQDEHKGSKLSGKEIANEVQDAINKAFK